MAHPSAPTVKRGGVRMTVKTCLAVAVAASLLVATAEAGQGAAAKVPDFNGVWRTINAAAAPRVGTTLRWLPGEGELPPFNAEYLAKYKKVQESRESGSEETEPVARCLPPGM